MHSSSSSIRSKRRYYTPEEIRLKTHCNCKIPIYDQVSWTPTNPGRRFKGCPTRKCEVYGFLDEELPSQYYKDLLYNLHEENKQLEVLVSRQAANPMTVNRATEGVSLELIYQELNGFKSKAKLYDSVLLVVFGLIIMLIVSLIVVSLKK